MKFYTKLIFTFFISINFLFVKADEGMWLPMLLGEATYKNMVECGIKLTPEQIYNANNSSLKDAIVALGGGFCTGEIISNQGLMMTNHHCGFGTIQANSSTENDYLTDGFWAMTKEQEIPADFGVWFLNNISDVTDQVLKGVEDGMDEGERNKIIRKNMGALKTTASEGKNKDDFAVQVKSFYYGNLYYMFTYNIFNDVRLVGAPPSSIGKFGGDTDNWMWPRHTGDFTMFRVYADKENNPSSYSQDNKPLKPKHSLPVSIAGVQDGDYAMIMGYPGSTDRFLTSWGVKQAVDVEQPARVKIRGIKLDIMDQEMSKSQKVRIQYASKYARVSNYWKYFIGQSEQLVKNKVFDKKQKIENSFSAWYKSNGLDKTYSESLPLIENALKNSSKYTIPKVYFQEAVVGSELILFMLRNLSPRTPLFKALNSGEGVKDAKDDFLKAAESFYKDYNPIIDENTLAAVLSLYANDVPKEFQPELLISLNDKYKGDFKKVASNYFKKSPFKSFDLFKAWLTSDKLSVKMIEKDLVYQLKNEFLDVYRSKVITPSSNFDSDYKKGMRLFVDGLQKMGMNKASDANSTMRFTYGNVLPYDPADAVHYDFYTTLDGVMQKEVVTEDKNHEFYVPQRLKDLYNAKDFGPYARKEDGKLPVGFLSNNDITGGNSGSPVINAHGELIGTAFDGNWEAMSGDIYFEPNIQRTISVDIRYSLFIIDKYAGAKHLIDEMNIVTERHLEEKQETNPASANPVPEK
ncbi:MAG: S46 family peptidase [Flavobacteriales bacterium]|nr:S46 family peptidase [Flavobacteriales bacterium]